jgi:hypothetical protein
MRISAANDGARCTNWHAWFADRRGRVVRRRVTEGLASGRASITIVVAGGVAGAVGRRMVAGRTAAGRAAAGRPVSGVRRAATGNRLAGVVLSGSRSATGGGRERRRMGRPRPGAGRRRVAVRRAPAMIRDTSTDRHTNITCLEANWEAR